MAVPLDFSSPFTGGTAFYLGVTTLARTATGSGTGTQTAIRLIASPRTATGSGTGSSSVVQIKVVVRVGADSAGTGSSAVSQVLQKIVFASGAGTGSSSTVSLCVRSKTATGSGTGDSSAIPVVTAIRTASGTGTGTSVALGGVLYIRDATGSGLGTDTAVWVKSHIFRVPFTISYSQGTIRGEGTANRLQSYNRSGVRALNLYHLTDDSYTTVEQRDMGQVLKLWHGGHDHFLTDAEVTELTAAGFGASIT